MKIKAIIPARYQSTRLPGKPIVDICGKPMLWWVYNRINKIEIFDDVICAIDDKRIQKVCKENNMKYVITSSEHPNHISRVHEVSTKINADYYVCVNGDEPLINAKCILPIIPKETHPGPLFSGTMRKLTDPAETIDFANIKLLISDTTGRCLYMSRTPAPYPRGTLNVTYKKYVGVECFNKSALDFFVHTQMGSLEKAEDIDHLRFLENGIELHFNYVESESISVDTIKDLEFVREKIAKEINSKNLWGDANE